MKEENLNPEISHVSDTALWVATYRAEETKRKDALFKDPLAEILAGERGKRIAKKMRATKYLSWSVIIRTATIDDLIEEALSEGVDTVVNLGAGLDTRPYRMNLNRNLLWFEADFPDIIDLKNDRLKNEKPNCQIERRAIDLTNPEARQAFFQTVNAQCRKALIITEGVIPYLSNEDVAALARDLRQHNHFKFWILEYFPSELPLSRPFKKLQSKLTKAPLIFKPKDWNVFFNQLGWRTKDLRFLNEEAEKLHRPFPLSWWQKLGRFFLRKKTKEKLRQALAYALIEPNL